MSVNSKQQEYSIQVSLNPNKFVNIFPHYSISHKNSEIDSEHDQLGRDRNSP